ncbi:retrotransposon protein, putative, ty1-copia subclass [Tanacetum coccineum]
MAVVAQNTNNTTIRYEGKLAHLEQPMTPLPYPIVSQTEHDAYEALTLENYKAYDMIQELRTMFEEQAKLELFEIVKSFHACKQEEGQLVNSYLLKMKSYLDTLERLGYAMPNELGVSLILNSPNKDYDHFVQNYNLHSMGKTLAELHVMLKLHEKGIPKKAETPAVLAIREGKIQKDKKKSQGAKGKAKGKNKLAYAPKTKIPPPPKRENLTKDSICHHCKEGLRRIRKLKHGALNLYMGNGMRAALEAFKTRILNMVPTKKVDRTPYEIWHGKTPILSYLRVWGCEALVKQDTPDKLDSRSIKCIFIGASGSHGLLEVSGSDKGLEIIQEEDTQPSENTSKEHEEVAPIEVEPQSVRVLIRRSARIPQAPDRYGYYVDVEEYELGDFGEPPNYIATLVDPESDKWLEAMNTEMQSMKDNQVWVLVELPPNGRTVGSKWLFKKKTDMDGNVHTFKACLVAKGYTQTYGVDYRESFSHVADIRAIRILLAIATFYDYEIWQMDVKTAFLNGHLSEDVYMQASRSWNKRFDEEIKKIGFTQNPDEPCVYIKASASNVASLVLYVDDILLMGNSIVMLQEVKSWLCSIMYAVRCTRPDVAFAQNLCCRFQQNPNEIHLTSVKTILKDLRNTKDMVLVYGAKTKDELKVSCYVDATVDCKSAKQITTDMSSTEAEYIVAAEASMEAIWMRKFIDGLGGFMPSNKIPIEMLCDNKPALVIARDLAILKGAIHFQRKYHYIRKVIQRYEIVLKKVHTDDNVAYPFTKPMSFNKHFERAMKIGIVNASSLM